MLGNEASKDLGQFDYLIRKQSDPLIDPVQEPRKSQNGSTNDKSGTVDGFYLPMPDPAIDNPGDGYKGPALGI